MLPSFASSNDRKERGQRKIREQKEWKIRLSSKAKEEHLDELNLPYLHKETSDPLIGLSLITIKKNDIRYFN